MYRNKQSGAVSLFVVIFAMLLLTVVTIGFLRIMMNDQRQSSDTDLSQSAYDSAQAGVEDAKRALLRYQSICSGSAAECNTLSSQLSVDTCNTAVRIGNVVPGAGGGEVLVQQNTSSVDADLDQAYTCVTMKLDTDDFVGMLPEGHSKIVPLKGVSDFNQVRLSWFSADDLSRPGATAQPAANPATVRALPAKSSWPADRPAIMRTQIMQVGSSFKLTDFDVISGGASNSNTLFLYPVAGGPESANFIGRDIRKASPSGNPSPDSTDSSPMPASCVATVPGGGYACSIVLGLPDPVGGGQRDAYLRLAAFYKQSHFQVQLLNSGTLVKFKGVQPSVDSTGRANDLFRRVQSRIELADASFPYPDAAVDVTTDFCKDFSVTDQAFIAGECNYN